MNQFDVKAIEKERGFLRKIGKAGYRFHTVKAQRPITIEKVTADYIYVRSQHGKEAQRISRSRLRKALSMLFYRRVTTLRQLVKLNCYSSSVAALIKVIMFDVCRVITTKSGAIRLTLKGLRYIFSGVSKGKRDVQIVKKYGGTFVLLNYYTIRSDISESWKLNLKELGFDYKCVILDPGEKTLHDSMLKGRQVKPLDIEEYAAFVKRHSDIIYQYLTLDKIGDPLQTKENTDLLAQLVGRRPVPIYHIQSDLNELDKIVDEDYDVIAIGGGCFVSRQERERKYAAIFNRHGERVNFHALGLGSIKTLLQFDWFSADASSWLNGRIFRSMITHNGVKKAPPSMDTEEILGYNIHMLSALEDRHDFEQMNINQLGYMY